MTVGALHAPARDPVQFALFARHSSSLTATTCRSPAAARRPLGQIGWRRCAERFGACMDIVISPLAAADVEAVAALARRVWQHTYPGIISQEQIDYMLDQRYRAQRVKEELGMATVWWDQLSVDGQLAGFVSCLLTGTPGEMKLDKLYVDPQRQRLGIGRRLVERVVARALENACETLILAVNKGNSNAIAAYRKQGFSIRDSVSVDIGGGFVMDDFIMARSLLAPATGPQQP